jgi:predicted nucleic acid-binding protein
MKYLLDTNVCIRYISGRSPNVLQKMRSTPADTIVVCSVVKAELFYGAMKANAHNKHWPDIYSFSANSNRLHLMMRQP